VRNLALPPGRAIRKTQVGHLHFVVYGLPFCGIVVESEPANCCGRKRVNVACLDKIELASADRKNLLNPIIVGICALDSLAAAE